MLPRSVLCLVLLLLVFAACTQDPSPTTTREALFTVDPGPGNRKFTVVQLLAANAVHTIDGELTAPYALYMENASAPVQGIIQPDPTSVEQPIADIALLFGGETIPRVVANPSENSSPGCGGTPPLALCVNSGCSNGGNSSQPQCDPTPALPPGSHEVRFDVTTTPQSLFSANVGGVNENHIINNGQAPATIYVEGVTEIAQGVANKFNSEVVLTLTLLVDGVVVDFDTSPAGSTDAAVVQHDLF